MTPDSALKVLTQGNARYVAGDSADQHKDQGRRCETVAGGQHPIAAILSCADSRVPVEMIFDQGIGDLFVIRVAGNVAGTNEIGTLEYGVGHLGVPLILVLGHTRCGAVTAVVEKAEAHGNVAGLLSHIAPAADKARNQHPDAKASTLLNSAIRCNVWQSIEDILTRSPEIRAAAKAGKVLIVGGIYDLHSGSVEFLGAHPQQTAMLSGEVSPVVASPAGHSPGKADDHAPAHGKTPTPTPTHTPAKPTHDQPPPKSAQPAQHTRDTHELIHDAAYAAQAAGPTTAPTTQPVHAESDPVWEKQKRTYALAGLVVGSTVLSALVFHIVRTHR